MTDERPEAKQIPVWMDQLLAAAERELANGSASTQPYWYRNGGREDIQRLRAASRPPQR